MKEKKKKTGKKYQINYLFSLYLVLEFYYKKIIFQFKKVCLKQFLYTYIILKVYKFNVSIIVQIYYIKWRKIIQQGVLLS